MGKREKRGGLMMLMMILGGQKRMITKQLGDACDKV
jgi:hypothetical protein